MPPSEAQRRAHQKHEATRKRVAVFLEEADAAVIDRLKDLWRLPSRVAVIRKLLDRAFGG